MSERIANPLPSPGRLGRAIRLAADLAELSLLIPLFTLLRVPMWAGELPLRNLSFYMLLGLTVWPGEPGTHFGCRLEFGSGWSSADREKDAFGDTRFTFTSIRLIKASIGTVARW